MRTQVVSPLLFLLAIPAWAQTVPAGWTVVKDSKHACQIAVRLEWAPWADNTGAAVFRDSTTAIAVVTSQPGQTFKPLTESQKKYVRHSRGKDVREYCQADFLPGQDLQPP